MALSIFSVGEFARVFTTRASRLAWFVGAGASVSAGIPTGYDMILDLKACLYADASNLPRAQVDPSDPLWAERITAYFDNNHGFPAAGDPAEYSIAFELMHPSRSDRRAYIEEQVLKGTASYGHRVLAALISAKKIPCIVTTNFDPLIEHAATVADDALPAADRANLTVATISTADRAERVVKDQSWPLLIKLHGDYQDTWLKNTTDELRAQDERLRRSLITVCQSLGLLVVGYSGRDESVMTALREAIKPGSFPAGLFWVNRPGSVLLPAVEELLTQASAAGIDAHTVTVDTFDDLTAEIMRQVTLPPALRGVVERAAPAPVVVPVKLPTIIGGDFPVLRCSALPILEMPAEARRLTLNQPSTTRELRDKLREARLRFGVAAAQGSTVAAFGRDEEIVQAFASLGAEAQGTIPLDPIADSWAAGLLVDGLVGALARGRPLRRRMHKGKHALLVTPPTSQRSDDAARRSRTRLQQLRAKYGADLTGAVEGLGYAFAEGVVVRLERRADRWWCSYEPFTWIDTPRDAPEANQRVAADWIRERWARRYNKKWYHIIGGWADLLTGGTEATIRCSNVSDGGVPGQFRLLNVTGWAKPAGNPTALVATVR